MQQDEILRFENVRTGYPGKEVIKNFTASIKHGEFVGLIGSNGTGKSTLIKCLSGLLPLTDGKIEVEGKDNATLKHKVRSQMMAVVPQSFNIDYDFTVEDIVLMGRNPYLSYRDREGKKDYEIVENAMRMTQTFVFKNRMFNELSGGEKQRVILARAIAQEPDIILLDEPTSALDIHHQIEMMELIQKLNCDEGVTVVAVLHDLNLASRFCKRLIMMQDGIIMADGTPEEVMVEKNLRSLYNMRMIIRDNPFFGKPEIVPLRVLKPDSVLNPKHIHIIGGSDSAVRVIERLDTLGHNVTAGVINEGSGDWEACKSLNLSMIDTPPFMEVTEEKQAENLKMMSDADVILIADVPFGNGNIRNLEGLNQMKGRLYVHKNCLSNDFTDGKLKAYLSEIEKEKEIIYISSHDEFVKLMSDTEGENVHEYIHAGGSQQ